MQIKRKRAESLSRTIRVYSSLYDIEYCPETCGLYSAIIKGETEQETDKQTIAAIKDQIIHNMDEWEQELQRDQRDES